ncbi:hypothetical protein BX666DRAFT_2032281 [Dichotomocladium elegans]|nr:hypothetical protein BX666DRAFT_2032281 [Dichotomocladium elegans]
MEFEEVSNFIKTGYADRATVSTWQQPTIADSLGGSNNRSSSGAHQAQFTHTKRPNPILGVSRLVNTVRRLKKARESDNRWQVIVSPLDASLGSPSSPSTPHLPTTPQLPNLQEIRYQMENFIVPANWHHPGDLTSIVTDGSGIMQCMNRTASRLILHLKECITRLEYLLELEQLKILAHRADTNDHVNKLMELDRKIHQLNAKLTLERLERTSHMNETLRTANARIPRLQILRDRQKWTATKIEGYVKHSNLEKRLNMLEAQTRTTHIEAAWARIREWGPVMTIASFLLLFIFIVFQFGI